LPHRSDFVSDGGFLLIIHIGFRKFWWISWISIFRPTVYKILNGQVAVPAASVDLILSYRPSHGTDANQQKLITVRSYTENYRRSYSNRTVKDWNSLPQSVVSAGSLASFKSRLTSHVAPWLHSPSVWCPSQGPCRLIIQIQMLLPPGNPGCELVAN